MPLSQQQNKRREEMITTGAPFMLGPIISKKLLSDLAMSTQPAEAVAASTGGTSLAPLAAFIGIVLIHKYMTQGEMGETIEQEISVEEK